MPNKFRHVSRRAVPKFAERVPFTEDQMRKIFKEHDKNGDGCLDKEELRVAFRRLGAMVPCYRAGRAVCYADIDGDGVINEDEIDHLVAYATHYGYSLGYRNHSYNNCCCML